MHQIAFLTMKDPGDFWVYDHLVHEPLRRRGIETHDVPWNEDSVDWNQYRMVVIRWPWDYWHHQQEFLSVLSVIEQSSAVLQNDLQTVRWNINKSYLRDLQQRGVRIVPTTWLQCTSADQLPQLFDRLQCDRMVIKPIVGAGAEGAHSLRRSDAPDKFAAAADDAVGRQVLAQPFIASVVETGEYSLIYFNNQYSHAILKTPQSGDFRVQEEYGGQIRAVQPDSDLVEFGQQTLSVLDTVPLYSRVDVVRLTDGAPALMEIELIEPSLYFPYDELSPDRMADAIAERLRNRASEK